MYNIKIIQYNFLMQYYILSVWLPYPNSIVLFYLKVTSAFMLRILHFFLSICITKIIITLPKYIIVLFQEIILFPSKIIYYFENTIAPFFFFFLTNSLTCVIDFLQFYWIICDKMCYCNSYIKITFSFEFEIYTMWT